MYELLKFNKKYYQPILTGLKTQTLRKSNKKYKENQIIKAIFPGTDKECYLKIINTGYKQFKYLTEEDAKKEGYETVNELKQDLLRIYPLLDSFSRVYFYRFKVLELENEK